MISDKTSSHQNVSVRRFGEIVSIAVWIVAIAWVAAGIG